MPTLDDDLWSHDANGGWSTAANWSLGVPLGEETADLQNFAGGTNYIVGIGANETIFSLIGGSQAEIYLGVGSLTLLGNSDFDGTLDMLSGTSLMIEGNSTFTYGGAAINGYKGTLGGNGVLALDGNVALSTTLELTVAAVDVEAGVTTLNSGLTKVYSVLYGGEFTLDGGTLNLGAGTANPSGITLTLSGFNNHLTSGDIEGPGELVVTGAATVGSISVGENGGAATIADAGSMTQTGAVALDGELLVESGATYTFTGAGSIAGASAETINDGAVILDASGGITTIGGTFIDNKTLTVDASNTLALTGDDKLAGTVNGGGDLTVDGGTTAIDTATAESLGVIDLAAGVTTFDLSFSYQETFTISGGTVDLGGHTLVLSGGSDVLGGDVEGAGVLDVTGAARVSGLQGGSALTIEDSGAMTQDAGGLGLSGELAIKSGAEYTFTAATNINGVNAVTVNAGTLTDNSGGGISNVQGSFTNTGTLTIDAGDVFRVNGSASYGGVIGGAGKLTIQGGAQTISSTKLTVGTLEIVAGSATLEANESYSDELLLDGGTLGLNGRALNLTGSANVLSAGDIEGGGALEVTGAARVSRITVGADGASATIIDKGAITQTGAFGLDGELSIVAGGAYTIDAATTLGGVGATIVNAGDLTIGNSGGTSKITGGLTSVGTLTVDSGDTLALAGADKLAGAIAGAGGTLDVTSGVTVVAAATITTLGQIEVSGGTLELTSSLTYGGIFDLHGGTLNLDDHALKLTGAANTLTAGTIDGPGTLDVAGAAGVGSVHVDGGAEIEDSGAMTQTGLLDLDGSLMILAGATYTLSGGPIVDDGATTVNRGTLVVDDSIGSIGGSFTNFGALTVDSGDTLELGGTADLGGAITGAGATLDMLVGSDTTIASTTANTFGAIDANGSVTLAVGLSYAGAFALGGSLALGGKALKLTGTANALAGVIEGSGEVKVTGAATVGSIEIEGELEDAGVMTQNGGTVFLPGELLIDRGATYQLASATKFEDGAIVDNGAITDAVGFGTTYLGQPGEGVSLTGTGELTIDANDAVELQGNDTLGVMVNGPGELIFYNGSDTTLSSTSLGDAIIVIHGGNDPDGPGAQITLGANVTSEGAFELGATVPHDSGDVINLNGFTLTLAGNVGELSTGGITGPGTLEVTGKTDINGLNFDSNGASPASLVDAGAITESGNLYLQGGLQINSGATYTFTATVGTPEINGGSVVNDGTLVDANNLSNSIITGYFTNNGVVDVRSGATLQIFGGGSLGGTFHGAGGALDLAPFGGATISTATVDTFSSIYLYNGGDGNTTTFAVGMTFAGVFDAPSAVINLAGNTLVLSGASMTLGEIPGNNGTAAVGGGTLEISGAAILTDFFLGIGGEPATLEDAGAITQHGELYIYGLLQIDAGATYTISTPSDSESDLGETSGGQSSVVNNGILDVAGGETLVSYTNGATFDNNGALSIAAGSTLTVIGQADLQGTVGGAGTLVIGGNNVYSGTNNTLAAKTLNIGTLDIVANDIGQSQNAGATVVTANQLYGGSFNETAGAILSLSGGNLTLKGVSDFTGATINGDDDLVNDGTADFSGLTIGGAATFWNSSSVSENGGGVTLTDDAMLHNATSATYDITDSSGIASVGSGSNFVNAGLFEKTAGAGASDIGVAFVNGGTVAADSGTLDFQDALTGAGTMKVGTGATLEVDGAVAATQTLAFSGSGGEISLDDLLSNGVHLFHGVISGFGAGDSIDVGTAFGAGTVPLYTENAAGTMGTLSLTNNSATASITFLGDYSTGEFAPTVNSNGATVYTFKSPA